MSDAEQTAWEEWIDRNRGRPEIWSAVSSDSFKAGFAAGGVAALEQAADTLEITGGSWSKTNEIREWLRDRAAQLRDTP